jgi:hypothetical protein
MQNLVIKLGSIYNWIQNMFRQIKLKQYYFEKKLKN